MNFATIMSIFPKCFQEAEIVRTKVLPCVLSRVFSLSNISFCVQPLYILFVALRVALQDNVTSLCLHERRS